MNTTMFKSLWVFALLMTLAAASRMLLNETVIDEKPVILKRTERFYYFELNLPQFVSCVNLSSVDELKLYYDKRFNEHVIAPANNMTLNETMYFGWEKCLQDQKLCNQMILVDSIHDWSEIDPTFSESNPDGDMLEEVILGDSGILTWEAKQMKFEEVDYVPPTSECQCSWSLSGYLQRIRDFQSPFW